MLFFLHLPLSPCLVPAPLFLGWLAADGRTDSHRVIPSHSDSHLPHFPQLPACPFTVVSMALRTALAELPKTCQTGLRPLAGSYKAPPVKSDQKTKEAAKTLSTLGREEPTALPAWKVPKAHEPTSPTSLTSPQGQQRRVLAMPLVPAKLPMPGGVSPASRCNLRNLQTG